MRTLLSYLLVSAKQTKSIKIASCLPKTMSGQQVCNKVDCVERTKGIADEQIPFFLIHALYLLYFKLVS